MIKELRRMRQKGGADRAKANYISHLQSRGKLRMYKSKEGYAAYDTEELKEYKKNVRLGRPPKGEYYNGN